jgi:hypothetical protein
MGDVLKAAAEAAWKTDPAFQTVAKFLYGDDVDLDEIIQDISKMDPAPADLHAPGVEDDEEEDDEDEVKKKNDHHDEHSGRFVSRGRRAVQVGAEVGSAGLLGGLAAYSTYKSPLLAKETLEAARAGRKIKAVKEGAKTVGLAGTGLTSAVAAGENAQDAHDELRGRKGKQIFGVKAARLEDPVRLLGEAVAKNLITPQQAIVIAKELTDKQRRGGTAVLSGIGAVAGAGGLAYGIHDAKVKRRLGRKIPLKTKALIPLEIAGLTGEIAATHILHDDVKHKKPVVGVKAARDNRDRDSLSAVAGGTGVALGSEKAAEAARIKMLARHTVKDASLYNFVHAHEGKELADMVMNDSGKKTKAINAAARKGGKAGVALGATAAVAGGAKLLHDAHAKKNFDPDDHEVTWEGEFSKIDEDKRQVFGWASVTEIDGQPVVDLQGDYIHPSEMERAAYDYVVKCRVGGDMHSRVDADGNLIEKGDRPLHISDMIESMVFTPEKVEKLGLPEGSLPTGWWVGFKVNDDKTWDLVKSGERQGFSIHGMGARMEKRLDEIGKSKDPIETLIEKAYDYSDTIEEFHENLDAIYERTGLEVFKAVGTQNRSGSTAQRQDAYAQHYLQQATQMMAPQVAQHIQQLQQQQWQMQQMEQQSLQNGAQQQNWQTLSQMGPRPASGPTGPTGPSVGPSAPAGPSGPTMAF